MTNEDRLRAALRLALAAVDRWVHDCPHARDFDEESCVRDAEGGSTLLCDGCRADVDAAFVAAQAVGLDPTAVGRSNARALALVRAAGLADPHAAAPGEVLEVTSVEGVDGE